MATITDLALFSNSNIATLDTISEKIKGITKNIAELSKAAAGIKFSMPKPLEKLSSYIKGLIPQIKDLAVNIAEIGDGFTSMNNALASIGVNTSSVYKAASRAGANYIEMGNAIALLGRQTSGVFGNQDELIAFVELTQKAAKISGTAPKEQAGATDTVFKAMSDGKLTGAEFSDINEKLPMIAAAISRYTKLSKSKLSSLSEAVVVSAIDAKDALFEITDEINSKFEETPELFSDSMNKLTGSLLNAFGGTLTSISSRVSEVIGGIVSFIENNVGGIIACFSLLSVVVAAFAVAWAVSWVASSWPILAIIGGILLLFSILQEFGIGTEQIIGGVCGIFSFLSALVWNVFMSLVDIVFGVVNYFIGVFNDFANFFTNFLDNPISSNIYMMQGFADTILGIVEQIARAIDNVFGTKLADGVAGWRSGLKEMADAAVKKAAPDENYQKKFNFQLSTEALGWERMEYGASWDAGWNFGLNLDKTLSNGLGDLVKETEKTNDIFTEGTGSLKSSGDVTIKDDNLKWLLDIATRRQAQTYQSAPISVQVTTGDIHSEADENRLIEKLTGVLTNSFATNLAY